MLVSVSCGVLVSGSASGEVSGTSPPQVVQRGIDTYFTYHCQAIGTIKKWAETEVKQFKALGANSIGLGFPLFTVSMTSNSVFAWTTCKGPSFRTPPPWVLATVVQIAHDAGLKVFLRPLIDDNNLVKQNPHNWRGKLEPTNVNLWFAKYFHTIKPYLEMAQREKVEYFAVVTELDSLADEGQWAPLIADAEHLYSAGTVEVTWSWDTGVKKLLWPSTIFGFDAYPKLPRASVTATPGQLLQGWDYLLVHRPSYRIPQLSAATISEIGIAAQDGSYDWPASGGVALHGHPFNQQIQANWFTAACAFMKQHMLRGIYFWGPWLARDGGSLPTVADTSHPSNLQPAGQLAIKKCFTGK
jgi:hypothetical protein